MKMKLLCFIGVVLSAGQVYGGNGDLFVDGNLGVGVTSSSFKLHVNGGPAMFSNEVYSNGLWSTVFGPRDPGTDMIFKSYNGVELVRITSDGKLGIGTASPYAPLSVKAVYPNVTTAATNYNLGVDVESYNLPISAGVTDNGYRIGLAAENFTNDVNFKGTLNQQYGVWARVGSYSANPTGTINNSYAIYLENLDGGATVGNKYGLYQSNSTAKNYFAGNVGIGTQTPGDFILHVAGNTKLGGASTVGYSGSHYDELTYNAGFTTTNNTYYYLRNDTAASIRLGYQESIEFRTAPAAGIGSPLYFVERMRVDPGGLNVHGTVKSNGSPLTSDLKFKKHLQPLTDSLKKVLSLNGLSYEWRTDEYKDEGFPEGRHYGVIAQEIEKVLPNVVTIAPDGTKAVAYTEIIPVLIEAIKEQQKRIEVLENRLLGK